MVKRISAVAQVRRPTRWTGARVASSLTCSLLSTLLLIAAPGQPLCCSLYEDKDLDGSHGLLRTTLLVVRRA
jgi:hypothetical protein